MIWLIAGLALACLLLMLLQWWAEAEVASAKRTLVLLILVVLGAITVGLVVAGKALLAVVPVGFTAWRLLGPILRTAARRTPQKQNNASMTEEEALDILGLDKNASREDVNQAYRRLMAQAHPDKGGSDWMAAKINEARELLLNTK